MTLSVRNLCFSYEKRTSILEKISCDLKKGEFIGIFGPNGGGKTTFLRLLLGLLKPSEGEIKINGKSPEEVSDHIGYVPQLRRFDKLFPISVLDVVLQGCLSSFRGYGDFSKKAKQDAWEALAKVGLEDKAKEAFGNLSGGQIQRTLIARALASKPEILLLDEATVGIDPVALEEVFQFLITLKGKITIVLVTHQLQAIAKDMDTLLCINRDLTHYTPEQVCGHFAMGLYHPPLTKKEKND